MKLRRTISILIVCMAASAPLFMPAYFIASRSIIRYEMMERMEKQSLSSIQILVDEFRWYKTDKEILVDGKMFDVKSIHLSNDTYEITGLFDEQEIELELVLEKKMEGSEIPQLVVQISTGIADLDEFIFDLVPPDPINYTLAEYNSPHFPEYCSPIVIPQPKTCLS